MPIDIYINIFSPLSLSVLYTTKHLNLDVNLKYLDMLANEHKSPEYLKINPAGLVPAIDDNGFILAESKAIMQYFCNQYAPDNDLYPKNPKERALVDRILFFSNELFPLFRDIFVQKTVLEQELDPEKENTIKEKFKLLSTYIGDKKYVVGNHLTIADLAVISLVNASEKMIGFDISDYPNIKEWAERLSNQCPYIGELAEETAAKFTPEYMEKMITTVRNRIKGQK